MSRRRACARRRGGRTGRWSPTPAASTAHACVASCRPSARVTVAPFAVGSTATAAAPVTTSAPASRAAAPTASAMRPKPPAGYQKPGRDGDSARRSTPPPVRAPTRRRYSSPLRVGSVDTEQLAGVRLVEPPGDGRAESRPAPGRRTCRCRRRDGGAAAPRRRSRPTAAVNRRRRVASAGSTSAGGSRASDRRDGCVRGAAGAAARRRADHGDRRAGPGRCARGAGDCRGRRARRPTVEAAGEPTDVLGPLDEHDVVPRPRRVPRGREPGRAATQHSDVDVGGQTASGDASEGAPASERPATACVAGERRGNATVRSPT